MKNENSENTYWQSIEEWRQGSDFEALSEKEFQASPLSAEKDSGWARRDFLKLMGASLALSSFGCVRRPAQKIVPYVNRPHEIIEGLPNYYASSIHDGGELLGMVTVNREGRPIHIQGNSLFPLQGGGMSARGHAHILSLYDPDRLPGAKKNLLNKDKNNRDTVSVVYEDADKEIVDQLRKSKTAILMPTPKGPSQRKLVREFAQAFNADIFLWDGYGADQVRAGQKLSFGNDVMPRFRFDRAKMIVSVDCDFLGTFISPTEFASQFGQARKPGASMARFVSFESLMTMTGSNSDERFRIKPSQQLKVLLGLAHEIVVKRGWSSYAGNGGVASALSGYANAATDMGIDADKFAAIAAELWANKGESIVVAGGVTSMHKDSLLVQVAANLLNSILQNDGKTIQHDVGYNAYEGSNADLVEFLDGIDSGKYKNAIIHQVNIAYNAPTSMLAADVLKNLEMLVYTGDRMDETALVANFVMCDHHSLENWGDSEQVSGLYTIQQPTISALGDTRAFEDAMISWMSLAGKNVADSWYEYLKTNWRQSMYPRASGAGDFEKFWVDTLHSGVFDTSAGRRNGNGANRSVSAQAISALGAAKPAADGMELALYYKVGMRDGDLANIPWLQELPDPLTKITWDNYLCLSPGAAEKLNLKLFDVVNIKSGEVSFDVTIYIQPGQHDEVAGIALGYGRKAAGKVGNGVGIDVHPLIQISESQIYCSALPIEIGKKKGRNILASTQGHHQMPRADFLTSKGISERQIVVEETKAQFLEQPGATVHRHKVFSMWKKHQYPGHKWGMVVDLSQCTGCSACVVACQSENNISVVGKKHVLNGREMHWIRIDRYYKGTPANPDTVHMPLTCLHCDNAPCETVCPVIATVHSSEGTNDMIYNRCVGTRYCANNCPYKVRRFNWFNYVDNVKKPQDMQLNPEVTVRHRGVMEKCTFCVHKIKTAKIVAKNEKRALRDGDVVTACQQSCPTKAITFGDLNDENSQVRKKFFDDRQYSLLEELNTSPALRYLTKVRASDEIKGAHKKKHQSLPKEDGAAQKENHS